MNDIEDSNEQMNIIKYRKVENGELANFTKPKGKYIGVYFITTEKDIIDNALEALSIIKSSEFCTKGKVYLKDVAADFVNIRNGYVPFLIMIK